MKRVIGLTGGIATGKSTVAQVLVNWPAGGWPLCDADLLAREAVAPGTDIWQQICDRYGSEIIDADGNLRRQQLGQIVFTQPCERQWLENVIHPFVRSQLVAFCEQQRDRAVLVVPLLFEAQLTDIVTEIWVVTCTTAQQLERLMQRDRLDEAAARARIAAQWPLAEKVARATVVLDNSDAASPLETQVHQAIVSGGKSRLQ